MVSVPDCAPPPPLSPVPARPEDVNGVLGRGCSRRWGARCTGGWLIAGGITLREGVASRGHP